MWVGHRKCKQMKIMNTFVLHNITQCHCKLEYFSTTTSIMDGMWGGGGGALAKKERSWTSWSAV